MALTAPRAEQKRFAGQIAWERGKTIHTFPSTSSALSGLIQTLMNDFEPLPIVEWQVEAYQRLVASAAEKVPGFDVAAYAEVPADRASANKAIQRLRSELSRVEYRAGMSDAGSYLADEGSAEAVAATADVSNTKDDVPF